MQLGCATQLTAWQSRQAAAPANRRPVVVAAGRTAKRLKYAQQQGGGSTRSGRSMPMFVPIEADASDSWRLDAVVDVLREGGVGILPTDTYPAFVCDIEAKAAVQRIYDAKEMRPNKQLSIMCRNLSDIGTYTLGFPAANAPGRPDPFRLARQLLPGPYTFILHASKELPKQVTDFQLGKAKQRKSVGVRMPNDFVCQAVLSQLDRPLLCSSVHVEQEDSLEIPESAVLADRFAGRGIDFVVDVGQRVAEGSTVIDLTGAEPVLVRQGKGDASMFDLRQSPQLAAA